MTHCHQNPDAIGRKGRLDRITADQNRFLQAVTNPAFSTMPSRPSGTRAHGSPFICRGWGLIDAQATDELDQADLVLTAD